MTTLYVRDQYGYREAQATGVLDRAQARLAQRHRLARSDFDQKEQRQRVRPVLDPNESVVTGGLAATRMRGPRSLQAIV